MIDTKHEELLTFSQASRYFPPGRRGKRPHRATLYRWSVYGVHGIRLESIAMPSCRVTSREAIARFLQALTEADDLRHPSPARTAPTIRHRQREIAAANRKLDAAGIR